MECQQTANLSRIERCCEIRVDKQDVLRLQISVCQLVVMQELHSIAELVRDVSDVVNRVRLVVVVLEEVEHTQSKNLERDACMAMIIEPIQDLHTQAKTIS